MSDETETTTEKDPAKLGHIVLDDGTTYDVVEKFTTVKRYVDKGPGSGEKLILLTRMNGSRIALNPDSILRVEEGHANAKRASRAKS